MAVMSQTPRLRRPAGRPPEPGVRLCAEEAPVALVHDGGTTAVMLATPADLEDFALGFSLTEGLIAAPGEVRALEVVEQAEGWEVRLWLRGDRAAALAARRRRLAGPTGCGLCGIDSLQEAARPVDPVGQADWRVPAEAVAAGFAALSAAQALGRATRAAHAAGLWRDGALAAAREDVGRHNALDKLAGALARGGEAAGVHDARGGLLLLTSRVSVELVQKAAAMGAPALAAVSAPTALAVRTAEQAGITLIAVARDDGFEVFTHPERVLGASATPAATSG